MWPIYYNYTYLQSSVFFLCMYTSVFFVIADPESENPINEDAEVPPQRKRGGKKCKIKA